MERPDYLTSPDSDIVDHDPSLNVALGHRHQRLEDFSSALKRLWRLKKFRAVRIFVFRWRDVQALVLETLRQCGILLQPIMPDKAALLLDGLGVPASQRTLADAAFGRDGLGDVRPGLRLFDLSTWKS